MNEKPSKNHHVPLPLSEEARGEAPPSGKLKGKRFLVVGGGQRIVDAETDPVGNGRAMCRLFATEGAHVAVADMNRQAAEQTVDDITSRGGQAFCVIADISKPADVETMIINAVQGLGGLDGLIDTPLGRLSTRGRPGRARTNIPGGRQGTGWEVAHAALFLMSGSASYISGQILAVDAGLTAIR